MRRQWQKGLPWKYTPEQTCRIFGRHVSSNVAMICRRGKAVAPAITVASVCCEQTRLKEQHKRGMLSRCKTTKLNEEVVWAVCTALAFTDGGHVMQLKPCISIKLWKSTGWYQILFMSTKMLEGTTLSNGHNQMYLKVVDGLAKHKDFKWH